MDRDSAIAGQSILDVSHGQFALISKEVYSLLELGSWQIGELLNLPDDKSRPFASMVLNLDFVSTYGRQCF
jgi:hypothetical protein